MTDTVTAHSIVITPSSKRLRIRYNGHIVADTTDALMLKEGAMPAIAYIPRRDAEMARLERSSHHTHCPFKGDAAYFSLDGALNAVWTYEHPLPAVAAIKDYLAFYPDKVTIEELAK